MSYSHGGSEQDEGFRKYIVIILNIVKLNSDWGCKEDQIYSYNYNLFNKVWIEYQRH